jgi:hypothetical protein
VAGRREGYKREKPGQTDLRLVDAMLVQLTVDQIAEFWL